MVKAYEEIKSMKQVILVSANSHLGREIYAIKKSIFKISIGKLMKK